MDQMIAQAKRLGVNFIEDQVVTVDLSGEIYKASGQKHSYECQAMIIATGACHKWLGLESEERFKGKGVSSCATCDGFFYKNKPVCV